MHAKVKIISICPAHFLAEYFVEALQDFAVFILFYFTCVDWRWRKNKSYILRKVMGRSWKRFGLKTLRVLMFSA